MEAIVCRHKGCCPPCEGVLQGVVRKVRGFLAQRRAGRHKAQARQTLAAMSPHLRKDLGVDDQGCPLAGMRPGRRW